MFSSTTNWLGTVFVIVAAVLVASNNPSFSHWAYVFYPIGSALLFIYFILKRDVAQIIMNLVMLGIGLFGATCWIAKACG